MITKITELTSGNDAASFDDVVVVVDDPGGTPVTKKLSLSALLAIQPGYYERSVPPSSDIRVGNNAAWQVKYPYTTAANQAWLR